MMTSQAKAFEAVLERKPGRLGWVVIRVPFEAAKVWGKRGQIRVKGEINGFGFRTSLFPDGQGGHALLVNKAMQKGGGVRAGQSAHFRLEADTAERPVSTPAEWKRMLRQSKGLEKFFGALNPSSRRDIGRWIAEPKSAQSRTRRAEQMAERLMETMEAERELPPMIRLALARNPQARTGWERMTAAQRRGELLGIFYYRTPEGRQRRIERMMERAAARSG